jgi:hypothetical protein
MNPSVFGVTNFLVPAAGQTHCVNVTGSPFTNQPTLVDWRNFRVDNFPFQPQGVIIDNSLGESPVTVMILPIEYPILCPAGGQLQVPFPAPNGQTASIIGGGGTDVTNVYFVDYPVLPFYFNNVLAGGAQDVIISSIATADALNVSVPQLATGAVPYRSQEYVPAGVAGYIGITSASGTGAVTYIPGAPNLNARKLMVSLSGDASLVVAGDTSLTILCNGTQIYKRTITLPVAGTPGFVGTEWDIALDDIGFNLAAGNISASLSTALSSGTVEINVYFTPQ